MIRSGQIKFCNSTFYIRLSIKLGTWNISRNIPEHPGASNNYHNYKKKYVKLNFQKLN